MKKIDLTGQRFGRLVVKERCGTAKDGQKIYLCQCDCGNIKKIPSGSLRSKNTKSCGCLSKELSTERLTKVSTKHGWRRTRLYKIWFDMRQRCCCEKDIGWHIYGGRGIKICDDWNNSFIAFGGHGSLQGLVQAMNQAQQSSTGAGRGSMGTFNAGEGSSSADYTAGGNPALMKWQGQNDISKTSRYLAKLGKMPTPSRDSEGYAYHQSPYQNMVIDQGLNAPVYATLSKAEFTRYCNQTNQTPFYRGWSGSSSKTRFESAKAFHTGTGMYGEGIYFGSKSTANTYGSVQTKAALSPSARVVDIGEVQRALRNSGAQRAFANSGRTSSSFSNNSGEAQMALKMGYNVIRTSWSYVVLTRDAVVISR